MFEVAQYAPLLHTRLAEVRGLRELPDSTKDLLFPIFVLRPWPRAKSLDKAFEKISDAIGGRPFGVDLEQDYPAAAPDKPAQVQFDELRSPANGFEAYYDKISEVEGALPVLQLTGDLGELPLQVQRMEEIGRGGFARIRFEDTHLIDSIKSVIQEQPPDSFSIFVDTGWRDDVLQQASWAIGVAQSFFDQSPDRPIVVCGSSFPMDFSKVGASKQFDIKERTLFSIVRNNLNANLIYGDWASTRPPSYDEGVRRTVARIDLSHPSVWNVFRALKIETDEDDDEWWRESYLDISERVVESGEWDNVPNVWGRYMIECTAADLSNSIKSPITAAAARINLHMHVQSHFNTPELSGNTDDPYED